MDSDSLPPFEDQIAAGPPMCAKCATLSHPLVSEDCRGSAAAMSGRLGSAGHYDVDTIRPLATCLLCCMAWHGRGFIKIAEVEGQGRGGCMVGVAARPFELVVLSRQNARASRSSEGERLGSQGSQHERGAVCRQQGQGGEKGVRGGWGGAGPGAPRGHSVKGCHDPSSFVYFPTCSRLGRGTMQTCCRGPSCCCCIAACPKRA